MRRTIATALILALGTISASAACPSYAPSSSADAIKANELRVICLQQEAAAATTQRKFEMDLSTLERSIQSLQLQQRLNSVPDFQLPQPYESAPTWVR
ncbi:hypothetical protein WH87_05300 [Devosia epidermidihirudinis]|uniref:Secreted protein n=1 Tax=Devosia epidermidihirudinis TaxID=1293439 RepID=A0A0F5QF72_9HYPH|nr:hypothetical protein [Devosia epidermidihirudinis]KKC39585.1 hypothetical protein WH87_05300 [Devosia epidermidihirudinis]